MLYYIGFYTDKGNPENRKSVLSATNKMKYIIDTIDKIGIKQKIVCCGMTLDKKSYKSSIQKVSDNISLKKFRTLGKKNILTKVLDMFFSKIQLICYLLKNVKSNDIMLVYHSPAYINEIAFVKRIKKCKLILEIEEIYADVSGDKALKEKEISLCKIADAFIFPTDMLNGVVNINNKPYVTIHGTYQVENNLVNKLDDTIIHVVYAGTFDPRKGGAVAAVAASEFLDSKYHIHILGFGSEKDKGNLLEEIEKVAKISECKVTYDGLISGEDYIRFIQRCHIGLSTQNPSAAFNATSFPSKILSYMSNGLRVVSIRIPAIETSAIGKHMYYYDKQTPEEITKAIMSVDMNDGYDGRKIISELDKDFSKDIKALLGEK